MSDLTFVPTFGWRDHPEEVQRVTALIYTRQGYASFADATDMLVDEDQGGDVFFWTLEEKLLGRLLATWNQGQLGSCVSHGWGRAAQDCLLVQIAQAGKGEGWEGHEVAREPIYGGSRVQVGGERGSYQDGSVGAWAADWVSKWGVVLYGPSGLDGPADYDAKRCREWGASGVPDSYQSLAKQHPVKAVAVVSSSAEAWTALGLWKPIAICGSKGRTMKRRAGGWCPVEGGWAHCQALRGRCTIKGGPSSPWGGDGAFPWAGDARALVYGNSWGGYLGDENAQVTLAAGSSMTLPPGHYLSTLEECESEFRQKDTFTASDALGWAAPTFSWDI